jgi:hypothetical protein
VISKIFFLTNTHNRGYTFSGQGWIYSETNEGTISKGGLRYLKTVRNKRANERIQLDMKVYYLQFGTMYSGTLKNISQNGMYIEPDQPLPNYSNIYVYIPLLSKLRVFISFNNNVLGIPVRVKRLVRDQHSFKGMGVMTLNSSSVYFDFMRSLTQAN